jgi:hypothetical protein
MKYCEFAFGLTVEVKGRLDIYKGINSHQFETGI